MLRLPTHLRRLAPAHSFTLLLAFALLVASPVAADYGYRGRDLLAERNVGGLTGHMAFDGARRLTTTTYKDPASATAFGENLGWNKRNQITSQLRVDLNEAGKAYRYDDAGRITQALAIHGEPPADLTGLDGESFRYDTADNLVERSTKTLGLEEKIALPTDQSGRNRPASFHGIPLSWDANGNLTDKGDLHFEYDYRNRVSRVTRTGHEVATYGYDAFNRRVEKLVEGNTQKTSWSGWQALEKFENGQATRAETSTYGQTTWYADSTPPAITQLRLKDGTIELRTSEEVRLAVLQAAAAGGQATLVETATNHAVPFLATQPFSTTPGTLPTRLVLTPSAAVTASTELRLRLEPAAIQDLFGNPLSAPFEQTLTWDQTADTVLADTAPPEVSHVLVRGTSLEIGFTEPLVGANVATAILLDGQPRIWTSTAGGEVWTTEGLADGDHTLSIAATPLDLAGHPLAEAFERTFRIEPSHLGQIVYRKPDPSGLPTSATGTALTFQGLELDAETGLLYVRNRYFDPELGRFITADPMGYPDGPSGYAFGAGDAVNGRDPMGLCMTAIVEVSWLRLHAILSVFADKLTAADPALVRDLGRTTNDAFVLRGFLALRRSSEGAEVAITVDIQNNGQQMTITSDACTDDGSVLTGGPTAAIRLFEPEQNVEIAFNDWLHAFELFLSTNESEIAAAVSKLS